MAMLSSRNMALLVVMAIMTMLLTQQSEGSLAHAKVLLSQNVAQVNLPQADAMPIASDAPADQPFTTQTATGNPVVSANSNEIKTIQEETADIVSKADSLQAQKELAQTVELERRKRAERTDKRAEEQTFKANEAEKKSDHRERQKDKFESETKKAKEQGEKGVAEENKKAELLFAENMKHSQAKKTTKIDAINKLNEVEKNRLQANRKVWENRVTFENEQLSEQKQKDQEQNYKQQNEEVRKQKAEEVKLKATQEMKSKRENFEKRKESDNKGFQERENKRQKRRQKNLKEKQDEEAVKRKKENDDKVNEMKGKDDRRQQEVASKAAESGQKKQEREQKTAAALNSYAEQNAKKLSEQNQKAAQNTQQQEKKQDESFSEQGQKTNERRKQEANLYNCNCQYSAQNWNDANKWYNCPGNTLLVGMFRQAHQDLSAIQHYRCCHACRPGGQVMKLANCAQADWVRSFDHPGWSVCPGNKYIQGFYKSGCNWIYCLEYANCCNIEGSSGSRGCGHKASWGSSFDHAGWNFLDPNHFMGGLYRSHHHNLYNIEFPQQCIVKAH